MAVAKIGEVARRIRQQRVPVVEGEPEVLPAAPCLGQGAQRHRLARLPATVTPMPFVPHRYHRGDN